MTRRLRSYGNHNERLHRRQKCLRFERKLYEIRKQTIFDLSRVVNTGNLNVCLCNTV